MYRYELHQEDLLVGGDVTLLQIKTGVDLCHFTREIVLHGE